MVEKISLNYTLHLRPSLEYAAIGCDGCYTHYSEKFNTIIATGFPIFASREALNSKTGWLQLRYYITKLTTMFKIYFTVIPEYIQNTVLNTRENISHYNISHKDQFILSKYVD